MENAKCIYSDEFYYIIQCQEYPYVPGFYTIIAKKQNWYISKEAIERLAVLEKTIRDCMLSIGVELAGIYREESNENGFRIFLIPYYVAILKENGISPDLYQPYIRSYLNGFNESHLEEVQKTDEFMINHLKRVR